MWEVYNEGRLPYENRSNAEVVESLNSGLRLLKPRLAPDAVYLLMEWCWKEVGTGSQHIPAGDIQNTAKLFVIMCSFFVCFPALTQKPEDRPSFALLLHELASLSDLWSKIWGYRNSYIYFIYWFITNHLSNVFQMCVKLFWLRQLQLLDFALYLFHTPV